MQPEQATRPKSDGVGPGSSEPGKRRHSKKSITDQGSRQYADAIDAYSTLTAGQSLYAGAHYKSLAGYLQQPYEVRAPKVGLKIGNDVVRLSKEESHSFVSLYSFDPGVSENVSHINSISQFESEACKLLEETACGQMLFMKGYPSPEWISAIGATYDIDPDFFYRHMDFRVQRPDYFSIPSLPSSSTAMITLRTSTIGWSSVANGAQSSQEALEELREKNRDNLTTYNEKLKSYPGPSLGESIIRNCSVHDSRHFTIEQDISIYVKRTEKSWIALVWLDHGKDLGDGLTAWLASPLGSQSWKLNYLPVVHHKPGIALKSRTRHVVRPDELEKKPSAKISQSASLLHLGYGRQKDRQILGMNSFYSLHDIFSFVAFADVQLLNMLESQINNELDPSALIRQSNPTLSNILYNKAILERYIERTRNTISSIQNMNQWPTGQLDKNKQNKVNDTAKVLRQDYQYLLARAELIHGRCNTGMEIIMNNAMIEESRKAMSQAIEVAKLTRLAFFFVPLSFTTSFFGMNFVQLKGGLSEVYIWVISSLLIVTISFLLMKYDLRVLLRPPAWKRGKRYVKEGNGIYNGDDLV